MREVGERMWLFTQAELGVKIDNLSDPGRVFRLPGTVRWSKNGAEAGRAAPVTTQWADGPVVPLERIREQTGRVWDEWKARQEKIRHDQWVADKEADRTWNPAEMLGLEGFALLSALDEAREMFPRRVSWASILLRAGWTKYGGQDEEGHQQWTRPGEGTKNPRSLVKTGRRARTLRSCSRTPRSAVRS